MPSSIFGISVTTLLIIAVAYVVGARYPGIAAKMGLA